MLHNYSKVINFTMFSFLFKPFSSQMDSQTTSSIANIQPVKCDEVATSNVKVNPHTNDPDKAWEMLKVKIDKQPVQSMPLDTPIYANKVRFVCISDTHSKTKNMRYTIPSGDVLIHAGDFSMVGSLDELQQFSQFLKSLDDKFKHKVVIAGNHELSFDPVVKKKFMAFNRLTVESCSVKEPRDLIENCIYLEESMVELFGIKIYGSPYQPWFHDWAFNVERGEKILKHWNKIPGDTQVLITHGPPLGFGDIVQSGNRVGCCELLSTIRERVRPKFHIFGHIHEDYGVWIDNQATTFINASICNLRYRADNAPIIFDMDLPAGYKKED